MLEDRGDGRYEVRCDTCGAVLEAAGADVRHMRTHLLGIGWFEATSDDEPRERWKWSCPACSPRRTMIFGG